MAKRRPPATRKPPVDQPFPPAWAKPDDPTGLPIRRATEERRGDVLAYLITLGVDVDAVEDFEDPTALMIATQAGHADLVRLLLAAGADPGRVDRDDETPLMIAARRGDRAVFALLAPGTGATGRSEAARVLASRERLARPGSGHALASLLEAARSGRVDAIREAIEAGAALDRPGPDGLSPLHLAACLGEDTAAASALLGAGADPDVRGEGGNTPAFFARSPAMIAVLAGAGADLDARDRSGGTTLHESAARGEPDRSRWLVAAGAGLAPRDDDGRTPLHSAASARQPRAFLALVEAGADLGIEDDQGRSPLDLARASFLRLDDQAAFIRLKRALVRGRHLDGRPDALLAAVAKGPVPAVEKLLARGAVVDALGDLPGRHGVTPLYVAATAGDLAMTRSLLAAGADPRAVIVSDLADSLNRRYGVTAREGAAAKGHREVAALLEEAEARR